MNLKDTVVATVFFFLGVIVSKVIVWDILDKIRSVMSGAFAGSGDSINLIFIILQWIITLILIFFIPIIIYTGNGDKAISIINDKITGGKKA